MTNVIGAYLRTDNKYGSVCNSLENVSMKALATSDKDKKPSLLSKTNLIFFRTPV